MCAYETLKISSHLSEESTELKFDVEIWLKHPFFPT